MDKLPKPKYTVDLSFNNSGKRKVTGTLLSAEYVKTKQQKKLKADFNQCFKGFEPFCGNFSLSNNRKLTSLRLPDTAIVFITFVYIAGFNFAGKGEKVAWSISFNYKGCNFAFSFQKYGLRLYYMSESTPTSALLSSLITDLDKVFKVTREIIKPYISQQMQSGNVTIANTYNQFTEMYLFFRKSAKEAFAWNARAGTKKVPGLTEDFKKTWAKRKEGNYFALAMCDAFFSRLDHLIILLLPFAGYDPQRINLEKIISSAGMAKFKRIYDIEKDTEAAKHFHVMVGIREKYRNPVAHGNFEKDGNSFYIHFPHIGAVPSHLGSLDCDPASILKISEKTFPQICESFDAVDSFISSGKYKAGVRLAQSGLDVAFDKDSLSECLAAAQSDQDFEEYLEHRHSQADLAANMDW